MNLFERVKASLDPQADPTTRDSRQARHIAAAVLLLEMEHADHHKSPEERTEIHRQLKAFFGLDDADADELIAAAESKQRDSVSLHRFLQVLNEGLDVEHKCEVLEMLWRVAYADRNLDAQEEHLLREIAELLYLPHRDFIKTKLAVIGR